MVITRDPALTTEAFIGRTHALNWLRNKLSAMQHCNLIGEPRIGKTSLLAQVKAQKLAGDATYIWVRLVEATDRQAVGFWHFLTNCVAETVALSAPEASELTDYFDWLEEVLEEEIEGNGRSFIFLLDDFDLLDLKSRDLDWLRALATRYQEKLAFVITSTNSLVSHTRKLIGDVSPLTNIFHNLQLSLFQNDEAQALIETLAPSLSSQQRQTLLQEAGHYPELLKIGCSYALDGIEEIGIELRLDEQVSWLCEQLWQRRTDDEKEFLRLFMQNAQEDMLRLRQLERLGLLHKQVDGTYQLFSFVFAFWLADMFRQEAGETTLPSPPVPLLVHQAGSRLVQMGNRQEKLTPLENRLLAYLHEHVNRVCTIQELLDNVWGANRTDSVVEKAINRLRQKVEEDPKRPRYILSARGEGYLLRLGS